MALGDCGLPLEGGGFGCTELVETAVDLGVDPADEERRHRLHRRGVAAAGDEFLEAGNVGLHHVGVAVKVEDQGDVDVAAFGDHPLDRGQALDGGGDLHHEVREGDPLVERAGGGGRALGVVREAGCDFEGDEAVAAVRSVIYRAHDAERVGDVGYDEFPIGGLDGPRAQQHRKLLVVVGGALDGLLEDRGVRGDAPHALADEALQFPAGKVGTLEVVDPGALSLLVVEVVQTSHGSVLLVDVEVGGQELFGPLGHVLGREAQLLHDDVAGGGGAEAVDGDGLVGEAAPPE